MVNLLVNIDAKVKDANGDICRVEGVYDDEILVSYGGLHAEDSNFLKHGTYTVIEDIRSDLEQQKQRADDLQELIERFLYANKEHDIYAINTEQELLDEYGKLNKRNKESF